MIHPAAKRAFLQRKLDSHAWMKSLTTSELDEAVGSLKPRLNLGDPKRPLRKHQKVCLLLGLAYEGFCFWLDMGTGKTRIMLELLRYWYHAKKIRCALIVTKTELAALAWEEEIIKWRIGVPYIVLGKGASEKKWTALANFERGLIVIAYGSLARLVSSPISNVKKGGKKLVLDKKKLARFTKYIDALALDESTSVMNKMSLQSRALDKISKITKVRGALAGRPIGRDPIAVWNQMYLVDRGASVGETLGMFRDAYFIRKNSYWGGGFEYKLDKKKEKMLAAAIDHRSISYAADECGKLARLERIKVPLDVPPENVAFLNVAVKALREAKGDWQAMTSAFIRMRQISSGFIGVTDDDTEEKAKLVLPSNPKLERLLELIEEVPIDRKWVCFHEFTWSGHAISEALKTRKIKHGWIYGGTKDTRALKRAFDTDPTFRGLVVNSKIGAYSVNMQAANYQFVFESPVGVIDREQVDKRLWRTGQTRPVFLYDFVMQGTMDQRILDFHKEGENLFKALLRRPEAFLAGS